MGPPDLSSYTLRPTTNPPVLLNIAVREGSKLRHVCSLSNSRGGGSCIDQPQEEENFIVPRIFAILTAKRLEYPRLLRGAMCPKQGCGERRRHSCHHKMMLWATGGSRASPLSKSSAVRLCVPVGRHCGENVAKKRAQNTPVRGVMDVCTCLS